MAAEKKLTEKDYGFPFYYPTIHDLLGAASFNNPFNPPLDLNNSDSIRTTSTSSTNKTKTTGDTTFWDDVRPLFLQCNVRCMLAQTSSPAFTIPLDLSNADSVRYYAKRIEDKLVTRQMPPNDPWSDDKIQIYKNWEAGLYLEGPTKSPPFPSPIVPFYPNPKPNDVDINFDDHISPMFTTCNQWCMKDKKGFDLKDFDTVNNLKKTIYERLIAADGHEMPPGNRWPQKNVDLFATWAKQTPKPKENQFSDDVTIGTEIPDDPLKKT
ncbi:5361_t:CDS:2 [Scutellospora calospora]|uniref:5361_t:CDS:1 n=1 Tax=Scutellospora calospora TaxID=85575 RepID=A0ACA9M3R3_9GLOM|nr:5361_t:CDS:2 [Scutellospora calospora]